MADLCKSPVSYTDVLQQVAVLPEDPVSY